MRLATCPSAIGVAVCVGAAVGVAVVGCSGATEPVRLPDARAPAVALPEAPLLRGPVECDGASVDGYVAGGALIVRGGKRFLASGKRVVAEHAPSEAWELVVVPTKDGPVLVGHDGRQLKRFDDPLGAPRTIHRAEEIDEVGAVPGAVHVLPEDVFLDVATGQPVDFGARFAVPPTSIRFADMRRGVAYFGAVDRFMRTGDGGASWTPIEPSILRYGRVGGDGWHAFGLHGTHGQGFGISWTRGKEIDLTTDGGAPLEPPTAAWIRTERRDPLCSIVLAGVPIGRAEAVLAGQHGIALMDLTTGNATDWLPTAKHCRVVSTTLGLLTQCSEDEEDVARHLTAHPLRLEGAVKIGPGSLVETASGAVATNHRCDWKPNRSGGYREAEAPALCIRQSDGTWATVLGATLPRLDGTGIAIGNVGGVEQLEQIDRNGKRTVLGRGVIAPDTLLDLRDVSEDAAGKLWVLAAEGLPTTPDPDKRAKPAEAWRLGKVEGTTITWETLEPAPYYQLRGSTTVASRKGVTLVREGPGAPVRRFDTKDREPRDPSVYALGFYGGRDPHLGFAPADVSPVVEPEKPDADSSSEPPTRRYPRLSCKLVGKPKPFALPPSTLLPAHIRREGDPGIVAWSRAGATLTVHHLDAFAPGTAYATSRFALPAKLDAKREMTIRIATVHGPHVALVLHADYARSEWLVRSGVAPVELTDTTGAARGLWIGDDGSVVVRWDAREGTTHEHFARGTTASHLTEGGSASGIGDIDAGGFSLIEASFAHAARARFDVSGSPSRVRGAKADDGTMGDFADDDWGASKRTEREPAISDGGLAAFRPAHTFAKRNHLRPCAKGPAGARYRVDLGYLAYSTGGEAGTSHFTGEVTEQAGQGCLARAAQTDPLSGTLTRVDIATGEADIVNPLGGNVQTMTCELLGK